MRNELSIARKIGNVRKLSQSTRQMSTPVIERPIAGNRWPELWDLYNVTSTSYRLRHPVFEDGMKADGRVVGNLYSDIVYTNLSQSSLDGGCIESGTITDATKQYVYAKLWMDSEGIGHIEIVAAQSLPSYNDNYEYLPLWFIPWDTDHINMAGIFSLRFSLRTSYIGKLALQSLLATAGGISGDFLDKDGNQVDVDDGIITAGVS